MKSEILFVTKIKLFIFDIAAICPSGYAGVFPNATSRDIFLANHSAAKSS
jgi:hypothetical protein